jgi:hypothetical protein
MRRMTRSNCGLLRNGSLLADNRLDQLTHFASVSGKQRFPTEGFERHYPRRSDVRHRDAEPTLGVRLSEQAHARSFGVTGSFGCCASPRDGYGLLRRPRPSPRSHRMERERPTTE